MLPLRSNGRDPDADEVKAAAKGRWIEILTRAGIPEERLDGKGHPCPKCGGRDRFTAFADVNERGAVNCRRCETKCGDGLATLRWLLDVDFPAALGFAAGCVGLSEDRGIWSPLAARPATCGDRPKKSSRRASDRRTFRIHSHGTPGEAEAAIQRANPTWKLAGSWDYRRADGTHAFTIVRFDLPELDARGKPKKEFRPIVACEGGFRIGGVPSDGRPLYELPSLSEAPLVFVCEGEKACGALHRLRLIATTSAFGAKSPEKTDWSPLAGKVVVLVPDNDEPGEAFLASVARLLAALDEPPTVRVLRLPNLPDGGDAHDWLEDLDAKESSDLQKELLRMADEADAYRETDNPELVPSRDDSTAGMKEFQASLADAAKIGVLGDYLATVLPHTESDEAAILMQALTAVGNCLGRTVHFRVGGDLHFPNLFTAIVGKSSRSRKGTSWGCARLLVGGVDPEWEANIAGGLSSGEGLIDAVRDPVVERARRRGRSVAGAAPEDTIVDPGVDDKRLLVVESELGKALAAMKREGNTLSAVLRQAWDGTQVLRTMAKSNRSRATDAHISLIGHIVEDELRSLLSTVDCWNGLANRFLWVKSERSKTLPFGGAIDLAALGELSGRVAEARTFYEGRPIELPFHDDACDLWRESYGRLTRDRVGLFDAVTARAEAQTRRIALVYAALDKSLVIHREHLEAALAVWNFAEASAAFIFVGSTGNSKRDRVLAAIQERPGMTRTELFTVLGRNVSAQSLDELLAPLEAQNLVRRRPTADGGTKRVDRFYPVPPTVAA